MLLTASCIAQNKHKLFPEYCILIQKKPDINMYDEIVTTKFQIQTLTPAAILDQLNVKNCYPYSIDFFLERFEEEVESFSKINLKLAFEHDNAEMLDELKPESDENLQNRKKRAFLLIGFAIVVLFSVIAIGLSSSAMAASDNNNQFSTEIYHGVKINAGNVEEIAEYLKTTPNSIMQPEKTHAMIKKNMGSICRISGIASTIDNNKDHQTITTKAIALIYNDTSFNEMNRLIADISHEAIRLLKDTTLTIAAGQLPIKQSYITTLKAKCLSLQYEINNRTSEFCEHFTFFAARGKSNISLTRMGVTKQSGHQKFITSTIQEIEIDIPILMPQSAHQLEIINLGRTEMNNMLTKLILPTNAIVMKNNFKYPFDRAV